MNIVIIPAWKRPAFLAACISLIKKARNAENYHYVFAFDRGADPLNELAIKGFPFSYEIRRQKNHRFYGNSFNILENYYYASALKPEFIFLIEEDIFIADDFFEFHEQVWSQHDPFFVCACKYHRTNAGPQGGLGDIFLHDRYQSLGVSFKTETVREIASHGVLKYFNNPQGYLNKAFPGCSKGFGWEQDGLIDHMLCAKNAKGIYPVVPRAFHAGFVGYNRTGNGITANSVNLWEMAEMLIKMDEQTMNSRARIYKDITRCNLTGNATVELNLI